MNKTTLIFIFFIVLFFTISCDKSTNEVSNKVKLETSLGDITIALDMEKAPKTVENFINYVNSGFYNETIFHRVIKGFMIQGGGLTENMKKKPTRSPVQNEADNGLKNDRGTIAMARTAAPDSATSQFFINTANNGNLNFRAKSQSGWGYCVFGKVISGMDVVDKIEKTPTTVKSGRGDVPVTTVTIKKASLIKE